MTKKRILIADDEAMVLRVLRLQLENAGYEVETAPSGDVALQKILAAAPDALITDIEMPRMSGEELVRALQAQVPDRRFPIFVVTSLTALRHRKWSGGVSNIYFLEKPLSARRLLAALVEYFAEVSNIDS